MTRALQDRLALASIKISKGWENRSLDSIQPELDLELKHRKRTTSMSDSSSSIFSAPFPTSSPGTAPIFSDELPPRSASSPSSVKRLKPNPNRSRRSSGMQTRLRGQRSRASTTSWKAAHQLPESSPTLRHSFNAPVQSLSQPSFHSAASTVVNSPTDSEDDDRDIPLHSFQAIEPTFASSPPRTPPSTLSRSSRLREKSPKHSIQGTKEGADLLMFLASSPSTNVDYDRLDRIEKTPRVNPPQTPPPKHTPLPSSMMSTPGAQNMLFGWNPNTPGTNFNLGDWLNVTPSPAQGAFVSKTPGRTPGGLKTPSAARETRRRLMFGASPRVGEATPGKGDLGIDLGGSLR